jgi:protein-S-isoprenylcysteine O-methyltransferase Ste14
MVLAHHADRRSTDGSHVHRIPHRTPVLGVPLALAGIGLFAWMFRHLGLNVTSTSMPRDSAKLVTSGPYRWIRHPMYSAALILVLAATLLTSNVVVLVGGITMFVLLAARSRLEEQRLIEKFGEAYRDYQHHTGRFVPRLTGGTP